MPIYEFECPKCHVIVEQYVSRHESGPPLCQADYVTMRQVISQPAPHQLGGVAGKQASAAKLKARNDAYQAKPDTKAAHMDGVRKRGIIP